MTRNTYNNSTWNWVSPRNCTYFQHTALVLHHVMSSSVTHVTLIVMLPCCNQVTSTGSDKQSLMQHSVDGIMTCMGLTCPSRFRILACNSPTWPCNSVLSLVIRSMVFASLSIWHFNAAICYKTNKGYDSLYHDYNTFHSQFWLRSSSIN